MTKQILNIVFDLGNVLVPVHPRRAYERLEPFLPPDKAKLLREDLPEFEKLILQYGIELECGTISFEEFQKDVKRALGVKTDDMDLRTIYCDIFTMDKGMVELGTRLADSYDVWLASNTSKAHYTWILNKFPEVEFYKSAALSYKLGVMKPAPEYFQKAIRLFGINPQESVFMDDLEDNVNAAVQAGMNGIVFRNQDLLIEELVDLGVQAPNSGVMRSE